MNTALGRLFTIIALLAGFALLTEHQVTNIRDFLDGAATGLITYWLIRITWALTTED